MVQEGIEGRRDFPRVNLHKEGEEPAAQVSYVELCSMKHVACSMMHES